MLDPTTIAPPAEAHQPVNDDVPAWQVWLSWSVWWAGIGTTAIVAAMYAIIRLVWPL